MRTASIQYQTAKYSQLNLKIKVSMYEAPVSGQYNFSHKSMLNTITVNHTQPTSVKVSSPESLPVVHSDAFPQCSFNLIFFI